FAGINMILLARLFCYRGAKLLYPGRRRVARPVFSKSAHHCFFDVLRRIRERLAALELIDGLPTRAKLHHAVANIYDVGKAYAIKARCEAKSRFGCGHSKGLNLQKVRERKRNEIIA